MLKLSLRARLLAGMGARRDHARRGGADHHDDDARPPDRAGRRPAGGGRRRRGSRRPAAPGGGDPGGDGADRPSDFYVGSFDSAGQLTHQRRHPTSPARRRPTSSLAQAAASADANGRPFTVDAKEDGGPRYRVVARRSDDGQIGITAQPLTDVDDTVNRLILVEVLATAIIVVVLGAVTWWVVRLGIRPIKQMTATAVRIADGDRTQRVPETVGGHRGRRARRRPQPHARAPRRRLRPAGGVRGPAAALRRRRLPRAAHPGDDDPRLRRAVPRRRAGRRRLARRGDAAHRAGGDPHGPPRRGPPQPGQARRGPAARAPRRRPRRARQRRRPRRRGRRPRAGDHGRRAPRRSSCAATRTACAR